jgi:hypothetical protein
VADVARELLVKLGIQFDDKSAQRAEQKVDQLKYSAERLASTFSKLGGSRTAGMAKAFAGGDHLAKKALSIADVSPGSLGKFQGSNDPFAVMSKSLEYAEPKAKSFLERITSIRAALVGLGAVLVVNKLAHFIQGTADAADELKAQAERIGTTTQALQGLQYAAQLSDTSAEALGSGLQFLARSAYAASQGSKEAHAAFAKLGVSVKDSNGKLRTTDQIMLDVADGLKKIESPAEKTALTMKVMGRSAGELVPFLSRGSAEILAFRQELEDLGGSFGSEFVDLADEWNDNGTRLGAVLKGIGAAMGKGILPPLNNLINRFLIFWKASGEVIRLGLEKFLAGIGNTINVLLQILEPFIFTFVEGLSTVVGWVGSLDSGLMILVGTLGVLTAVLFGFLSPWLLLGALVALIVEDIYTFFVGGDSVTGKVVESFKEAGRSIMDFFSGVFDFIVEKFNVVGSMLSGGLRAVAGLWGGDVSQTITAQGSSGVTPSGGGANVINAPTTTNAITVHASAGMDENALADKVAQKISEHEDERNREAFGALVPAAR